MVLTAIEVVRRLIARGRDASDDVGDSLRDIGESVDKLLGDADRALQRVAGKTRTRKAPLVLTGLAAAIGGYLLGKAASGGPGAGTETTGAATTAVSASRPQPPQSDGSGDREPAAAKT
jgi:hypothetical protein